jgi:hypothetical protein
MKVDADEKDLLESVERGEWKSVAGGKRVRTRFPRYAKATFRRDRRLQHSSVEQGSGGDPKTRPCGRIAIPDADRQPAAQVRRRPTEGDLDNCASVPECRTARRLVLPSLGRVIPVDTVLPCNNLAAPRTA